jgi:hypothetical protein
VTAKLRSVVVLAAILANAAGGQSERRNNQSDADGSPTNAVSGVAEPEAANDSGMADDSSPGPETPNSTSSGMPVPGTNTPEHIVVNSDEGNHASAHDLNHE